MVLYFIQFMDKTTLGSSAILGIRYVLFLFLFFCCSSERLLIINKGSNPFDNEPVRMIPIAHCSHLILYCRYNWYVAFR